MNNQSYLSLLELRSECLTALIRNPGFSKPVTATLHPHVELPPILSTYFPKRHLNAILRSALCFSDRTLSETFIDEYSMSLICTFLNLPMQLTEHYVITDCNCKTS